MLDPILVPAGLDRFWSSEEAKKGKEDADAGAKLTTTAGPEACEQGAEKKECPASGESGKATAAAA